MIDNLPSDWKIDIVKNHCKITTGSKNTQDAIKDGDYPFFVRSQTIESINTFSFDGEAVLTAGDGVGVGKVFHYINGKFDYHQRVYNMHSFSNQLDGKFFYLYFKNNFDKQVQAGSAKTSVDSVRLEMISLMPLPLPNIKEQQKIAKILTSVDESIEATNKIIAKQKRVKTALMQDLLTRGIDENGNIRSEETHEFKDSVLGRIPKEWELKTISNICIVKDGTHQTPKYVSEGMPFYSVETITKNNFENVKYITIKEHLNLTKNFRIERNDVLMTRIGSIGDCKYIDWDVDASFYVSLALLKFNNPILAQYFTQYSNHQIFETEISLHSLSFAIPKKINLGNISDVRVILPSNSKEQEKIINILLKQDEAIEQEEQKLKKLQSIKKALMKDLLTGKVRVNYE